MEPPIHRGAIGALLGPGDFPQEIPLINPARPFGHLIYPSVTPATPSPAHIYLETRNTEQKHGTRALQGTLAAEGPWIHRES